MKKTTFFAAAMLFAVCATFKPTEANAQKAQGQVVLTGGAGYSLVGIILNSLQDGLNYGEGVKSTKTPVIWGAADYGITSRFSVGACYTYQSITAKYGSYTTTDTAGNNVTYNGDFTDRLSRQSIGIRPLFHLGDNEDMDVYIGARFSYVFWNFSSHRTDDKATDFVNGFGSPIKPQFILGMRYFFIPAVGFNAEFAIGPTYFMAFGLNYRFGGV